MASFDSLWGRSCVRLLALALMVAMWTVLPLAPTPADASTASLDPATAETNCGTDSIDGLTGETKCAVISVPAGETLTMGASGQITTGMWYAHTYQRALIQLAKDAKRRGGLPNDEAEVLADWADEYGLAGHAPMTHQRPGWSGTNLHINVGTVKHIPVL